MLMKMNARKPKPSPVVKPIPPKRKIPVLAKPQVRVSPQIKTADIMTLREEKIRIIKERQAKHLAKK